MQHAPRCVRAFAAILTTAALASCGGGGGGSSTNNNPPPGVAAQSCSANNPYIGDATAPTTIGDLASEKTWLRDYMDRKYLWYTEVPNINASAVAYSNESDVFASLNNYFNALLTPAKTASNKSKDKFSFAYSTAGWNALVNSGTLLGYGIEWHFDSPIDPPRNIRVEYVHAGSPADASGIKRGDTLVLADGVSADVPPTQASVAALSSALFPAAATTHSFQFSRAGGTVLNTTWTAGNVTLTVEPPRVLPVGGNSVGYILFNDHVLTAEQQLISAFQTLKTANVSDLVLDLRYNGGGYLFIASEVAYMIAGDTPTANKAFMNTVFNNKRSSENSTTGFRTQACVPDPAGFDPTNLLCRSNAPLPTLNLSRVYVLVSGRTSWTSEAIINGLRGVDIDVRLIGSTTRGVPYGVGNGQDNCGITYFPIESQSVNAKGFGDYADGFNPGGAWVDPNAAGPTGFAVPGCAANDDLNHQLGDPAEGQLAAALAYRASGTCPP